MFPTIFFFFIKTHVNDSEIIVKEYEYRLFSVLTKMITLMKKNQCVLKKYSQKVEFPIKQQ